MRIINTFTLVILIGIVAVGMTITSARAVVLPAPADWDNAFALQTSGGPSNPGVLVGFNPQPEPPGTTLNLSNPLSPTFTTADVGDQPFRVLFAMSRPGFFFEQLVAPNAATGFAISAVDQATKLDLFHIFFSFTTSSNGVLDPLSVVGFNPQPEPPGVGFEGIGFDLELTSLSTATMTLQIQDIQGNDLNFAVIPLPAALPLYGTGLAVMGFLGWRRKRQALRD